MGTFRVDDTFYLGSHNLLVLTGSILSEPVLPRMTLFLPRTAEGEGRVPIAGVEHVQFPDGPRLAITVPLDAFTRVPGLEFADLHDQVLDVR